MKDPIIDSNENIERYSNGNNEYQSKENNECRSNGDLGHLRGLGISEKAAMLLMERNAMKRGTERIRNALGSLGKPQDEFPIIMVGGTNGKTSTVHYLSQLLGHIGYKVGSFTSPNPDNILKDIQVWNRGLDAGKGKGTHIPPQEFSWYIEEESDSAYELTSFELEVVSALLYFREQKIDVAVMEMGMGGEGDAVFTREPDLAVITNVSVEHKRHLGDTLKEIARNKAAIIPKHGTIITSTTPPALTIIESVAREKGADLIIPNNEEYLPHLFHLMVDYHKKNASLAMEAALRFVFHCDPDRSSKVSTIALIHLAQKLTPPEGRLQVIDLEDSIKLILDGAHNPAGFEVLFPEIRKKMITSGRRRIVVILGILDDKDHAKMVDITRTLPGIYICVAPPTPRALDPHTLVKNIKQYHPENYVAPSVGDALETAQLLLRDEGGLILLTGSLYMVAESQRYLSKMENMEK